VPTTPRQAGQPAAPGTDNPPVTRPGGQPDGPPTVGGGEKARGNRYQNGTLERWDAGQQRWLPIAQVDGGGTTSSSGRPGIADLDQIFKGQPAQRQRYEDLSRTPTSQLSPDDAKFVIDTRRQIPLNPGTPLVKYMTKDGIDRMITGGGGYSPDKVFGSIARADDVGDPPLSQVHDALGLDDSASIDKATKARNEAIAQGKTPDPWDGSWSPVPANATEAYKLTWTADDSIERDTYIPFGGPEGEDFGHMQPLLDNVPPFDTQPMQSTMRPFTGTGTTSGGEPEWIARGAQLSKDAKVWKVDGDGNATLYAQYDPNAKSWKLAK